MQATRENTRQIERFFRAMDPAKRSRWKRAYERMLCYPNRIHRLAKDWEAALCILKSVMAKENKNGDN